MIVGLLEIDLSLPESHSLKEKRQILRSLLDGLRNRFNISAAEVERQDAWQRAVIGIAVVSNDTKFCVQVLNKVMDTVRANPRVVVVDYSIETL